MRKLNYKFFTVLFVSLQFICCGDLTPSRYILEFPAPPEHWVSLLGEPHWHLEWLDPGGHKQITEILPCGSIEIELPVTWTNPVTAWPYWPDRNLYQGLFKPAGALFPFDVMDNRLCLSWENGKDAVFYWELTLANDQNSPKMPAYYDWPRFRRLFSSTALNEAVRIDPWSADWRFIAEKTINSNFDQRRLVPESVEETPIPVPAGLWYGSSPFSEPLYFEEDEQPVFPVRSGINVWISADGILRCNGKAWIFNEMSN
ncbi:MAG: hypothetical protein FWC03_03510 [Treponema sp.]|nr:hypothetical protein [Treponema sp.]